ncbi:ubiquitin- ligase [Pyrrhoderma noxium]|uniref:Anaphase-promoting complex subunit 2 n=1 Tax=Pyrrhoderma noxium TaxID=2282107 RepID=A0A286UC72_9AGAM|nr:ubiquitin- ligase [Pyrrhoderma noxium]
MSHNEHTETNALKNIVREKWEYSQRRLNADRPGISGLVTFSEAWSIAQRFLWPRDIRVSRERDFDAVKLKEAFQLIAGTKMLWILVECFVQDLRKQFHIVTEEIDAFMEEYESSKDVEVIRRMMFRIAGWCKAWAPVPELGSLLLTTFNTEFQTHLFAALPPTFPGAFKKLCESTIDAEKDPQLWYAFDILGLLDRYENLVASVCYERIEARTQETCVGRWREQVLPGMREWMRDTIVPWMTLPYARGARTPEETTYMLASIGQRFDYHVCKSLCELRVSEIFDIFVDFPDSTPALIDLRECLQRVDMRAELVSTIRQSNRNRLLHPGADTKSILIQYTNMIRCLRIIDPPGVLLHKIADPIRRYLRERADTIRNIVSSLVGEGGDLLDENEPPQPLQMHAEDYSDPNWEPEPIDAGPEFRTSKSGDMISTLISIYDSKDLFVKELQVLLAQRLLAISDGKFEKERRNLEILKVRFGEAPLQVCEIMLRDMTESRRIDQHIQAQKQSILHPTIISKQFWPALQVDKISMPGQLKQVMEDYSKDFKAFKQDKKLRFLPQLGTVDLTLELKDRTLDFTVSPIEAAVIELFSSNERWSVSDLSKELNVGTNLVRKALDSWMVRGVVREEEGNVFLLLEEVGDEQPSQIRTGALRDVVIEEQAPAEDSKQQEETEQMRIFWRFIEGMLTNIGALPLDRIQTMLRLAPNYTRTIEQLGAFMEAARREGLVTVNNGLWKLNR